MHDPRFPELTDKIQGKYSFKERPQYGIVIRTGSANKVTLGIANFQGVVHSHVALAPVENYPGLAIEWVREDGRAIQDNNGEFPTPPGIYYIELTDTDTFYIDPLYDVRDEAIIMTDPSNGLLEHPFLTGTLRIYEMPSGFQYIEGANYTANPTTGEIVLTQPLGEGLYLVADYRYPGETTGPHKFVRNHSNNTALPGVVLAFGSRIKVGDRHAIIVYDIRQAAAMEYGGKWELAVDVEVISRDIYAQQEISDYSLMYLWAILRPRLSTEGIEMLDVSLGGESEEPYDENADDYYYNATFSISVQTDWVVRVPLSASELRTITDVSSEQMQQIASLTDEQIAAFTPDQLRALSSNIQMVESIGLRSFQDPFFVNRNRNFEMIR
jgi:hypothetical protein